jgi:hypothetical protein
MPEWKKPPRWIPGDEITAEKENIVSDDLEYLKEQTDDYVQHKIRVPLDHPFNSVMPHHLRAVNYPGEGQVPVYRQINQLFEWRSPAAAAIELGKEIYDLQDILWVCEHWLPPGFLENQGTEPGSVTWMSERVDLNGGLAEGGSWSIWKDLIATTRAVPTWNRTRRLAVLVSFDAFTGLLARILTGGGLELTPGSPVYQGFGFEVQNEKIYGITSNRLDSSGGENRVYLMDIPASDVRLLLEAVLAAGTVYWYINGEQKAYTSANVPSGDYMATKLFYASVYATEAGGAAYRIYAVRVLQEGTEQNPWT